MLLESFSGEFEHLSYPPHNYRNCAGDKISAQTLLKKILMMQFFT